MPKGEEGFGGSSSGRNNHSIFLYSLPFLFSPSGERKKTPLSTWINAVRLQHAAQTGRGRVFLGINSWQHREVLPTRATAQKSCVNSESEQDALGRVTAGPSSRGPIENHTWSSCCSPEAPRINSLGFQSVARAGFSFSPNSVH